MRRTALYPIAVCPKVPWRWRWLRPVGSGRWVGFVGWSWRYDYLVPVWDVVVDIDCDRPCCDGDVVVFLGDFDLFVVR